MKNPFTTSPIRPGVTVTFGRPNGERTLAIVLRVNAKSVLVQTLEPRGVNGRSIPGSKWRVAWSLLELADSKAA